MISLGDLFFFSMETEEEWIWWNGEGLDGVEGEEIVVRM